MTEATARRQLARMLGTLTAGSILHLLADLHRERAAAARRGGDDLAAGWHETAAAALFVFGLGVDAACPR